MIFPSILPEDSKLFWGHCEIFKTFPRELSEFQIELRSEDFVNATSSSGRKYLVGQNSTHWFLLPLRNINLFTEGNSIETKHYHKIPKHETKS